MSIEIKINPDEDGVKPKNFLKKKIDLPFFKIINMIRDKKITINKKKIKKDDILKSGDIIKIWPDDVKLREVKGKKNLEKNLNIDIIYENNDFIVFNKKAGIVVQGAQDNSTSLSLHLNWYKSYINDNSNFNYFHAHRLDKDTSGVLVVAKNLKSLRELNKIFREKSIIKKYVCLTIGSFDKKEGFVEVFMKKNNQDCFRKMSVCSKNEKDGKKSLSYYKVLEEISFKGEIFSLVDVEIKTGITHQIRVHMKYLNHPILFDEMYGNSVINKEFNNYLSRQFLHAKELEFTFNGKVYNFKADLTEDLQCFLNFLKTK